MNGQDWSPVYTGRAWPLVLPDGTRLLSANARQHWAPKSVDTARLRSAFGWLARAQKIPRLQWVHVLYYVRVRGRFDPANWEPTAKAGVDGLVDAGVLADDSHRYVLGPDPRPGMRPGFTLVIRELAEPPPQESAMLNSRYRREVAMIRTATPPSVNASEPAATASPSPSWTLRCPAHQACSSRQPPGGTSPPHCRAAELQQKKGAPADQPGLPVNFAAGAAKRRGRRACLGPHQGLG